MKTPAMKAYATKWKSRHARVTDQLIEEDSNESVEQSSLILHLI